MSFETLALFGEPERPQVAAPPAFPVKWASFHPANRVQCAYCVQMVHARRGAGRVDIRTATRRRTCSDGELLLCALHAEAKHAEDVAAKLVPAPRRAGAKRKGRR